MKKLIKFLEKKETAVLLAFVTAFFAALNYGLRTTYVFTDIVIFSGFVMTLLTASIAVSVGLLIFYVLKVKKGNAYPSKKAVRVLYFALAAYSVFFIIFTVAVYFGSGVETHQYSYQLTLKDMPYTLSMLSIVFLAVVMPNIKKQNVRKIISVLMVICVILSGILTLFPYCSYKITSDPMVIDNGKDYSVVFSTNDEGTGFIEYEFHGEKIKKYDENAGRLKADSKIHTINVPKEHLISNSYRVGSKRVIADLSYGSRTGKEVCSDYYAFSVPQGDNQSYLTVSDWHIRLEKAYSAAQYAGDYDAVILLGDPAAGLMTEEDIRINIVEFGGRLSGGIMPVIYVRGNHETRGAYASKLPDYLGMDSFYYDTAYGDYEFIVLDSGEDKDDSHPEYGGLDNYNQYRKDMIGWLSAKESNSDKKTFVLVHSDEVCIEEDLSKTAYDHFKRLGMIQLLSGHQHELYFSENNGIRVYVDGGILSNREFVASKLTLGSDSYMLEAWNQNGEKKFEKTLEY